MNNVGALMIPQLFGRGVITNALAIYCVMAQSEGMIALIQPLCWSTALKHPGHNDKWRAVGTDETTAEKEHMFPFPNSSLISEG